MVTVSVIIPVFNGGQTIAATLESVKAQSFTDFEVLVIDDGSTDETADQASRVEDTRIQYFHQQNQGVIASRNRGIALAQGDYLAFLDGDDLWLPDKLAQQVAVFQTQPTVAAVYCWVDYIDGCDRLLRRGGRWQFQGQVYRALIERNFIESPSSLMVTRAAAQGVVGFDPQVKQLEDWDFNLRLAADYCFGVMPQVGVLYRKTAGSRSTQLLSMEQAGRQILHRACLRLPQVCPEAALDYVQIMAEARADFYSYLFYVGFQQCRDRTTALGLLGLFLRGLQASPKLWQKLPKKWLLIVLGRIVFGRVGLGQRP